MSGPSPARMNMPPPPTGQDLARQLGQVSLGPPQPNGMAPPMRAPPSGYPNAPPGPPGMQQQQQQPPPQQQQGRYGGSGAGYPPQQQGRKKEESVGRLLALRQAFYNIRLLEGRTDVESVYRLSATVDPKFCFVL